MIEIDIEMPKNCKECPCSYFTEGAYSDYCQIVNSEIEDENIRLTNCPLKETNNEKRMDKTDSRTEAIRTNHIVLKEKT